MTTVSLALLVSAVARRFIFSLKLAAGATVSALGRRHPEAALTMANLGLLLTSALRRAQGLHLCRRAVQIFNTSSPRSDPRAVAARRDLERVETLKLLVVPEARSILR